MCVCVCVHVCVCVCVCVRARVWMYPCIPGPWLPGSDGSGRAATAVKAPDVHPVVQYMYPWWGTWQRIIMHPQAELVGASSASDGENNLCDQTNQPASQPIDHTTYKECFMGKEIRFSQMRSGPVPAQSIEGISFNMSRSPGFNFDNNIRHLHPPPPPHYPTEV